MTSFFYVVSYCHLSAIIQTMSIIVETYRTIDTHTHGKQNAFCNVKPGGTYIYHYLYRVTSSCVYILYQVTCMNTHFQLLS